jgi:GH15 family glucan-1,4-alpha-glucosidase
MVDLVRHSIATIRAHQQPNGAYVASPTFDTYAYSWLRDGSFIAHAMDRVGEHASAAAFHRWVGMVLARHDAKLAALTARRLAGETIPVGEQMHCRFTLDGGESAADWTNFQLDGYGTWLWALADHITRNGDRALYADLRPQVARLVAYLRASWDLPCYDCWEEFSDKVHTATLAALYGGLQAAAALDPALADDTPAAIRAFVLERCLVEGRLAKYVGSTLVDASLLGAAVPHGLFAPDDPIMRATVARIERDLLDRGVRRYREDTYYGGGEWVLLAAWLGWFYAEAGATARARALLEWVAAQADADGHLPEQVSDRPLSPAHVQPWVARWGPIARPLLWSHAMYLILNDALGKKEPTR